VPATPSKGFIMSDLFDAPIKGARLTDKLTIKNFIFGNFATFTLRNTATGNRFTYKIKRAQYDDPKVQLNSPFFVHVLTGPDMYSYMATIFSSERTKLIKTKASHIGKEAVSWCALSWLLTELILSREMPSGIEVWHEGQCSRCGRPLTDPDSIARGIGPTCYTMEG
jgi:uncharacterized protein DUF6011